MSTPCRHLGDELRAAARECPGRPFLRMPGVELSFAEVDRRSDALARAIAALGIGHGDRVSLMLPNSPEFVVIWFAVAKLGAVTAPVNTAFKGHVLRDAIDLVGSRLLLAHRSLRDQWMPTLASLSTVRLLVEVGIDPPADAEGLPEQAAAMRAKAMQSMDCVLDYATWSAGEQATDGASAVNAPTAPAALSVLPAARAPDPSPSARGPGAPTVASAPDGHVDAAPWRPPEVQPSDLCLLLYTSGTTGRSKAAMMAHRFVLSQADGVIEGLGLRRDDVLYCPYPMFHLDAAVMTIAPALRLRAVAAIGERFSVSRYWDEVRDLGATVFDFMGATLTMLWKQPPSPRDREHRARLGWGVPLPAWAPEFEARFGCRLVELYGSTEVGAILYTPQDEPRRTGSCGRVGRLWEVQLHDPEGFEVPVGAAGELVVRPRAPDALTRGYFGMPEATLAAFRDQWFHTGDVLRRDADGHFYFVGRTRDIVRRRGENISSAEVEQGLESHPDVLEAAVFGVPSELTEEDVMACIVARPGSSLTAQGITAHAMATMARFMVPRYIRFVEHMPRTPTDKVEKFRLAQQGITADTWERERPAHPT
jgi:acyl-CoA synthetase (AMP-forming)/AMP-acid ligase II